MPPAQPQPGPAGPTAQGLAGQAGNFPDGPLPFDSGAPGPLRFFNQQLAGQFSWLLPLALSCLLAAGWQAGPRRGLRPSATALFYKRLWPVKPGASLEIGQTTPVRPDHRGAISTECRVAQCGQQDAQTGLGKCARGERR